MPRKNPTNKKKPDPDPDHPSNRKVPPSREVKKKEREVRRREKDNELEKKLRGLLGPGFTPPPRTVPPEPDTLEEDIGNVQQPPPGVKHDARLNRRNSGLAGMLNLLRYKP